MNFKLITAPAVEPVTTTEAKSHLRVDLSADDTLIGTLITAARQMAENYTLRALCTQTWDLYRDGFYMQGRDIAPSAVTIPRPPLQSVTSVTTYDGDNVATVFASSGYLVDTASEPGRVVLADGEAWPTDLRSANGVVIRFVAGYGVAADVPQQIKQAILQTIGHLYENREAQDMPGLAKMLLEPYRVLYL